MSPSTQPQAAQLQGKGPPDAAALALAQAVQEAVQPDTVILFGSRARGDHRPGSDVDLMIVCQQGAIASRSRAKRAVRNHFKDHPAPPQVDIIAVARERFEYCRRAKNHVTAQALRDGVVMSEAGLNYGGQYDDDYPASWPDVKERLQAAYRHLGAFSRELAHPDGEQEIYGFHAQQAVENALKAWLSAADLNYRRVHDLEETAQTLLDDPDESRTLAAEQLRLLLDYTRFAEPDHPGEYDNWLTRYAVHYRYGGTTFRMTDLDRERFSAAINLAVHTFANRAGELTGTDDTDVFPGSAALDAAATGPE